MDQLTKLISGLSLTQRISIVAAGAGRRRWNFRVRPLPARKRFPPAVYRHGARRCRHGGAEAAGRPAWNTACRTTAARCWCLPPSWPNRASRWPPAGLPKTGRIGFELFDKSNFGATEFVEHINYKRALEGELERSVMSLAEVETGARPPDALQGIRLPRAAAARQGQRHGEAQPGAQISPRTCRRSPTWWPAPWKGSAPEAVSVVDMDGTLLNRPRKPAVRGWQRDHQPNRSKCASRSNTTLVAKISQTLEPLLGAERLPRRRLGGLRPDQRRTAGRDARSHQVRHAQLAEDRRRGGSRSAVRNSRNGVQSSGPPTPPRPRLRHRDRAPHREHHLSDQPHRSATRAFRKASSSACRWRCWWINTVQWEGDGANRKRVLVPPPPETLKTIRELVAGVNGLRRRARRPVDRRERCRSNRACTPSRPRSTSRLPPPSP